MIDLNRDTTPRDAKVGAAILGGGALAFRVLGLVAPKRLARMMDTDADAARAVGFRDVGNGLAFAFAPTSLAALQRMLYDIGDAVSFGPRKPGVAAGAPLVRRPRGVDRVARTVTPLRTGAEMRLTGVPERAAVICVNGGQAAPVEGTWSASLEWLVPRLAKRLPGVGFAEVRYRVKSWKLMDKCAEDTRAAVEEIGADRTILLGFSMGGAVATLTAHAPSVVGVLGLAPWLPDRLDLSPLRGKRLDVLHGMLDRWLLPGIPGVSPAGSRRGFERAQSLGVEGTYELIPGAVHGIALRSPVGVLPLPRAGRWAELAGERIDAALAEAA